MFRQLQTRLLLSYLLVLATVLMTFTFAVRTIFARSLHAQLISELQVLAQAASLELELENGELNVDNEPLVTKNQAIQWFDPDGQLIDSQGEAKLALPINFAQPIQEQHIPPIKGLTIQVIASGTDQPIGYVRVSDSLMDLRNTLQRLDVGLGSGVAIALILSGIGGLWLTRQSVQPVKLSFEKLQQFTSDASHELRSPLTAIKTNVSVALKYPEGIRSTDIEKFEAIQSAAAQMTTLTEELLVLARLDQHQSGPPASRLDLSSLLAELAQSYQPQANDRQIDFMAEIAPQLNVLGHEHQLVRLFTNLLTNALRYTHAGGQVQLQAQSKGQAVVINVRDTGIGLAPEHLDRVFDRFWQAEQTRTYQLEGAGLGLAIVKGITDAHRGQISVTSELGQGSCFTVRLPLQT